MKIGNFVIGQPTPSQFHPCCSPATFMRGGGALAACLLAAATHLAACSSEGGQIKIPGNDNLHPSLLLVGGSPSGSTRHEKSTSILDDSDEDDPEIVTTIEKLHVDLEEPTNILSAKQPSTGVSVRTVVTTGSESERANDTLDISNQNTEKQASQLNNNHESMVTVKEQATESSSFSRFFGDWRISFSSSPKPKTESTTDTQASLVKKPAENSAKSLQPEKVSASKSMASDGAKSQPGATPSGVPAKHIVRSQNNSLSSLGMPSNSIYDIIEVKTSPIDTVKAEQNHVKMESVKTVTNNLNTKPLTTDVVQTTPSTVNIQQESVVDAMSNQSHRVASIEDASSPSPSPDSSTHASEEHPDVKRNTLSNEPNPATQPLDLSDPSLFIGLTMPTVTTTPLNTSERTAPATVSTGLTDGATLSPRSNTTPSMEPISPQEHDVRKISEPIGKNDQSELNQNDLGLTSQSGIESTIKLTGSSSFNASLAHLTTKDLSNPLDQDGLSSEKLTGSSTLCLEDLHILGATPSKQPLPPWAEQKKKTFDDVQLLDELTGHIRPLAIEESSSSSSEDDTAPKQNDTIFSSVPLTPAMTTVIEPGHLTVDSANPNLIPRISPIPVVESTVPKSDSASGIKSVLDITGDTIDMTPKEIETADLPVVSDTDTELPVSQFDGSNDLDTTSSAQSSPITDQVEDPVVPHEDSSLTDSNSSLDSELPKDEDGQRTTTELSSLLQAPDTEYSRAIIQPSKPKKTDRPSITDSSFFTPPYTNNVTQINMNDKDTVPFVTGTPDIKRSQSTITADETPVRLSTTIPTYDQQQTNVILNSQLGKALDMYIKELNKPEEDESTTATIDQSRSAVPASNEVNEQPGIGIADKQEQLEEQQKTYSKEEQKVLDDWTQRSDQSPVSKTFNVTNQEQNSLLQDDTNATPGKPVDVKVYSSTDKLNSSDSDVEDFSHLTRKKNKKHHSDLESGSDQGSNGEIESPFYSRSPSPSSSPSPPRSRSISRSDSQSLDGSNHSNSMDSQDSNDSTDGKTEKQRLSLLSKQSSKIVKGSSTVNSINNVIQPLDKELDDSLENSQDNSLNVRQNGLPTQTGNPQLDGTIHTTTRNETTATDTILNDSIASTTLLDESNPNHPFVSESPATLSEPFADPLFTPIASNSFASAGQQSKSSESSLDIQKNNEEHLLGQNPFITSDTQTAPLSATSKLTFISNADPGETDLDTLIRQTKQTLNTHSTETFLQSSSQQSGHLPTADDTEIDNMFGAAITERKTVTGSDPEFMSHTTQLDAAVVSSTISSNIDDGTTSTVPMPKVRNESSLDSEVTQAPLVLSLLPRESEPKSNMIGKQVPNIHDGQTACPSPSTVSITPASIDVDVPPVPVSAKATGQMTIDLSDNALFTGSTAGSTQISNPDSSSLAAALQSTGAPFSPTILPISNFDMPEILFTGLPTNLDLSQSGESVPLLSSKDAPIVAAGLTIQPALNAETNLFTFTQPSDILPLSSPWPLDKLDTLSPPDYPPPPPPLASIPSSFTNTAASTISNNGQSNFSPAQVADTQYLPPMIAPDCLLKFKIEKPKDAFSATLDQPATTALTTNEPAFLSLSASKDTPFSDTVAFALPPGAVGGLSASSLFDNHPAVAAARSDRPPTSPGVGCFLKSPVAGPTSVLQSILAASMERDTVPDTSIHAVPSANGNDSNINRVHQPEDALPSTTMSPFDVYFEGESGFVSDDTPGSAPQQTMPTNQAPNVADAQAPNSAGQSATGAAPAGADELKGTSGEKKSDNAEAKPATSANSSAPTAAAETGATPSTTEKEAKDGKKEKKHRSSRHSKKDKKESSRKVRSRIIDIKPPPANRTDNVPKSKEHAHWKSGPEEMAEALRQFSLSIRSKYPEPATHGLHASGRAEADARRAGYPHVEVPPSLSSLASTYNSRQAQQTDASPGDLGFFSPDPQETHGDAVERARQALEHYESAHPKVAAYARTGVRLPMTADELRLLEDRLNTRALLETNVRAAETAAMLRAREAAARQREAALRAPVVPHALIPPALVVEGRRAPTAPEMDPAVAAFVRQVQAQKASRQGKRETLQSSSSDDERPEDDEIVYDEIDIAPSAKELRRARRHAKASADARASQVVVSRLSAADDYTHDVYAAMVRRSAADARPSPLGPVFASRLGTAPASQSPQYGPTLTYGPTLNYGPTTYNIQSSAYSTQPPHGSQEAYLVHSQYGGLHSFSTQSQYGQASQYGGLEPYLMQSQYGQASQSVQPAAARALTKKERRRQERAAAAAEEMRFMLQ